MNRVMITGPTGSIGIALINNLIERGIETVAVVRPDSARKTRIPSNPLVTVVECGLANLSEVRNLVEGTFDVFYHFGWDGTFGNSRNNMYGQNLNVKYTLDAVELAAQLRCRTFIGAGSQAEYGRFEGDLNADIPTRPENGYGIAKLCAGQMSRIACEQKEIAHIWTRILSIYGPYDGDKTMVMSTIGKILNNEKPALTKGEQQWDYLYSMDAGYAMYLLGEKGISGKTYCLGSGQAQPLLNYIKVIRDTINPSVELGIGEIPYGEKQVMYLCADISELREDVGFEPQYTFEDGIRKTIEWYKENH